MTEGARISQRIRRGGRQRLVDAPLLWDRLNRAATRRFEARAPVPLPSASQAILAQLNRDGVSTFPVGDVLDDDALADIGHLLDQVQSARAEDIKTVREQAQHDTGFFDPFRISLFEGRWRAAGENAILNLALQPALKAIVDAYVGLDTVVARPRAWRTFGTQQPPRRSQLFHVDYPLDRYMVKVFAYFTDVDRDCGPLTFLPGTHPKGRVAIDPNVFHADQLARSRDDAIEAVFPRGRWRLSTGPAGTLTLADFRAWHRGGWGARDRVHAQALYVSPAARRTMRGRD